jgi:class 3 adenylate cyclase/tetratricopeptide (TPR) repeat protein
VRGTTDDQVAQLESAIAAQESLRATLGDATVDLAISAMRGRLAALRPERPQRSGAPAWDKRGGALPAEIASRALASLQGYLPQELAAKAQASGSTKGERKQVTVLFADLSGFTALSESADPELIRAFQKDLFRDLARIIYQHEGFVEKFVGDAILAMFGAPIAHEDDAERALRVALAMRERMAVLNRAWAHRLGSPVTLHVGINTGPVVAGMIESGFDPDDAAYAVTGDTVNTAARIQNAAQPGQILASRTTYRLAQGAFIFQALEPVLVKNKREPLTIYELVRARPLPGKVRGIQELGESFVGRDTALAQLEAVTDGLNRNDGSRVVVITGDAGLGKSRLIAEWHKRLGDSIAWLEGRCFAHTEMLSYGPFLDMLRRFAGVVDDDSDRRARQRLDRAVEELVPASPRAIAITANLLGMRLRRNEVTLLSQLSARELRERIFELASELFTRLARDRPLVIFLEDMHWADQTTFDLIEHLLTDGKSEPIAIVFAGRHEPDSALDKFLARVDETHSERTLRIGLEPLTEQSSEAMVHDLLSSAHLPPQLTALISRRADGNPFFVEEILRALIERGALQRESEGWLTTPLIDAITVPDTLQGLIMARIDRLPDETKQLVQYAAVIGRTFLYRILLAVARSSPTLDVDLSHLQRSELILEHTRHPEVEFMFKHALTQEMAYESLLRTTRRELHRRVGEAMERIFAGRLGEYYSVVAEHYSKGEVWEKATQYHLDAGKHASEIFAAEARQHFEEALEALNHLGKTQDVKRRRIDATLEWTREVVMGAGFVTAEDTDEALKRLAQARADGESLAPRGRPRTRDDRLRLARVYAGLAQVHSIRGDEGHQASEYLEKIQALETDQLPGAELAGHIEPEQAARIGQVLVHQGRFNTAEDYLRPAVDRLEDDNRWVEWIHANGALAHAEAASGRYIEARRRADRGVLRAKNLHGQPLEIFAYGYLGWVLVMGGEWKEAEETWNRIKDSAEKLGHPAMLSVLDTLQCGAHARHGEHEGTHIDQMNAVIDEVEEKTSPNGGRRHLNPQKQAVYEAWHGAFHAQMALHCGDFQKAQTLAHDALIFAETRDDLFGKGLALRIMGQSVAAGGGSVQDVDRYMRESRETLEAGGSKLEKARTLTAWAMLKPDDPDRRERLEEARRIFESAGLGRDVERVDKLLGPSEP